MWCTERNFTYNEFLGVLLTAMGQKYFIFVPKTSHLYYGYEQKQLYGSNSTTEKKKTAEEAKKPI